MTKRIISGVFLLIALGALGLILAGALTSGEQLIVRFLTAIIVAALCLYVISDLRLHADDSAAKSAAKQRSAGTPRRRPTPAQTSLPPNSTAAFMATVTGKRSATGAPRTAMSSTVEDDRSTVAQEVPTPTVEATPAPSSISAYDDDVDAEAWPQLRDDPAALDVESSDGLIAIFTKREEPEVDYEAEPQALAANDHYRPPTMPTLPAPNLTPITGGALAVGTDGPRSEGDSGDGEAPENPVADGEVLDENTPDHEGNALDLEDDALDLEDDSLDHEDVAVDEVVADPHANPEPVVEPSRHEIPHLGTPEAAAGMEAGDDQADELVSVEVEIAEPTVEQATPTPAAMPVLHSMPGLEAAARARARVIELLTSESGARDLDAAIESGELQIITSLIEDGTLSAEGPISDRDVRTMVYVAFTSNELRKILLAGGRLDGEFDEFELDLGPVDVFRADDPAPDASAITAEIDSVPAVTSAPAPPVTTAATADDVEPSATGQHPVTAG